MFGQFHFLFVSLQQKYKLIMARKDQILTAGALYVSTNWDSNIPNVLIECFEKGADWADTHPLPSTEEDKVKVRIRNCGEADATIVREMTKAEYEFLSDIAQDLMCEGKDYSPMLFVDVLNE